MTSETSLRETVLRFDGISFGYPGYPPVLENFSAELYQGEIVCIIGASGCGKTTLLNLAGGFLKADDGTVFDSGGAVENPHRDRIMVFQDSSQLFPWLTVRKNVMFPVSGGILKKTGNTADKTALRMLELVGLSDAADLYPARLSGGMKQRAVIARALSAGPELLLLDEPFTALDAPTRRGLQNLLIDINLELGVSMMFVTHDIREAVYIADRILIMTPGCVNELKLGPEKGLERRGRKRDEFSDEFVAVEREIFAAIENGPQH